MPEPVSEPESLCIEEVFQRVIGDLSMIVDRSLDVHKLTPEITTARPAGRGEIHISFRLGFAYDDGAQHGCLLVPLPDASTLVGSLMMISDDMIAHQREQDFLDVPSKDAMLEVGNFIAGATEGAFRALGLAGQVSFEGCQGVRADVRPALIYDEGTELVTGTAEVQIDGYEACEYLLMVPRAVCNQKA